jgi:DNA repair protein RadC
MEINPLVSSSHWSVIEKQPEKRPLSYRYKGGCIAEFKLIRLRECSVPNPKVDEPIKTVEIWDTHVKTADWFDSEKESFVVFFLNTRRGLTGFHLVSIGTLDTILVHAREVFRPAIISAASAIILAHNHPSGDPTPSEADIKVTRDLIRAGQLLKIEVMDHIIRGLDTPEKRGWVSLRELGYFYN